MTVPALRDTKEPNKLILCFDGTGNSFSGSNADTNVVKILNKLDRQHPQQFHYYQSELIIQPANRCADKMQLVLALTASMSSLSTRHGSAR
jgi:hypothetical protein